MNIDKEMGRICRWRDRKLFTERWQHFRTAKTDSSLCPSVFEESSNCIVPAKRDDHVYPHVDVNSPRNYAAEYSAPVTFRTVVEGAAAMVIILSIMSSCATASRAGALR